MKLGRIDRALAFVCAFGIWMKSTGWSAPPFRPSFRFEMVMSDFW